ncbi:MAG TPA: hypothetical protein VFS31_16205, partial [Chitinophagaceae bacterium]|nr:hypothetical protein [Chitinophagaceae bacterium]
AQAADQLPLIILPVQLYLLPARWDESNHIGIAELRLRQERQEQQPQKKNSFFSTHMGSILLKSEKED